MIKVKYNIGSKPHSKEFITESEFVEWIIDNFKHKIFEISGAAEKGIILKNIDLTGITLFDELNKLAEERAEFKDAILVYMTIKTSSKDSEEIEECKNHVIEEFWDTVQVKLGLLDKLGITAQEVMQEYPKHLEKIKNRPRVKEELNHD